MNDSAAEEHRELAIEDPVHVFAPGFDDEDADLAGYDEHLVAQIVWHGMKQSVFKFAGQEVTLKVDEYLPPTNMMKRYAFVCRD